MWDNLISLMKEIVAVYQVVLDTSRRKKQALIAAKVEELVILTKQEEYLILQIGQLESSREQLVTELAERYAISPAELTLSKAKELAGGETADALQALETELVTLVDELTPLNQLNTQLIQQSLSYVNYNLNILTQSSVGTNYAPKGQGEAPRPKTLIDAKI